MEKENSIKNTNLEKHYNDIIELVNERENRRKRTYRELKELHDQGKLTDDELMERYNERKYIDSIEQEHYQELYNQMEKMGLIKQEQYNQGGKYFSSIVYKINLYSFVSSNRPDFVQDDPFDSFLNFSNSIFATVVDNNHIKEITTGMVFPIVDLSNANGDFSSYVIKYDNLKENDILFAISENKILRKSSADLEQLGIYLNAERKIIEGLIQEYQESAKVKIKK